MESPQALRVLVAFAEPDERDAASSELQAAGMVVVAACGTGGEALDAAAVLGPEVCVLDEDMPADAIAAARPAVGLVVVARDHTEAGLARAIAAGAHAYLETASDPAQLAAAVAAVADGHVVYPQSLMKRLLGVSAA